MRIAEIVIIGGGVVGASVAYHLTQRGTSDVLILERAAEQGTGSTGKATGGIRAQFGTDINIAMSLYSIDFFENCEFDCGYDPKGYLFLATNESQLSTLKDGVKKQRDHGYTSVEIVDVESIKQMVPGLFCDDIVGGSFGARDGFIDPLAVMRGFTCGALKHGAGIEFDTEVSKIKIRNGRVEAVETNHGEIGCGAAVLCAGAWSAPIAATAGVDLPVQPLRRQIIWARTRTPLPLDLPMVIEMGSGFHFRPAIDFSAEEKNRPANTVGSEPRRDVLFAYPDPDVTPSISTEFDQSFIDKVRKLACNRTEFLKDCDVIAEKCRAGLYENTPDRHAILGGCNVEGLYLACGFSGHGVMHSPATGRALSEIILDGKSKFLDVNCLNISRFTSGELISENSFI